MSENIYAKRICDLRKAMSQRGIDVYVMVNSDPHESEYLPDHWKSVRWLTGFRGEVATVIITKDDAHLWTDSRFFLSGAEQLEGSGVTLMKMKIDLPAISWLNALTDGKQLTVAGDRRVIFGEMAKKLNLSADLIDGMWTDRPALPKDKVEIYDDLYNGETATSKIGRIRAAIGNGNLFLKELDDIAWTLNLRGSDIHCTPVFTSYLLITNNGCTLFIDHEKLTPSVCHYLDSINVGVKPYDEAQTCFDIPSASNPVPLMKAIKNETEIAGYRSAMLKDGIALTQFYHWLEDELPSGKVTEMMCVDKLREMRSLQPLYKDESFDAIVAWNSHGALPHYEPTSESDICIKGDGLLLIDTGGHYLDGTTDITRTIGIGNVSDAMKRDYTLVLKGHIRLAKAVFPTGTRGDQLDTLARMDLWRDGKTYRHGTSHGVGHYLGVHEGPESVRMEHNPQQLLSGMFFSNEPAIYLGGQYGIRHENCVLVRRFDVSSEAPCSTPCNQDEQGDFLCLETLTLCYIDTTCIDLSLMNKEEIEWINDYHDRVFASIAPHLNGSDKAWLATKCKHI